MIKYSTPMSDLDNRASRRLHRSRSDSRDRNSNKYADYADRHRSNRRDSRSRSGDRNTKTNHDSNDKDNDRIRRHSSRSREGCKGRYESKIRHVDGSDHRSQRSRDDIAPRRSRSNSSSMGMNTKVTSISLPENSASARSVSWNKSAINPAGKQNSSKAFDMLRKELRLTSAKSGTFNSDATTKGTTICRSKENPQVHYKSVPLSDAAGTCIKDSFSTGTRPDLASDRLKPYVCKRCPAAYMMATQLSDHLWKVHNIKQHASLLKPRDVDDELKGFGQRGDIDPMDM